MKRQIVAALGACVLLAGCYANGVDERQPTNPDEEIGLVGDAPKTTPAGMCKLTRGSGCIEGQIPAAPGILVDGKEFFDAEDFAANFSRVITVNSGDSKSTVTDVKLVTAFDNKTFARGFFIAVKGDYAATAEARMSGNFFVNKLPEGEYKMRVSKPIRFEVTKSTPAADATAQPTIETKPFCGTLYGETTIDVRAKERTRMVFDDFDLYIADGQCPTDQEGIVLSL
jgi:hypothetical protein